MTSSDLLQKWYDEVWNKANESYIDEVMHKDIIIHGLDPVGTTKGIENFKVFYKNFRENFPKVHIKLNHLVGNEEFATAYCIVSATNNMGKDVSFTGLSVVRIKDGKLVEGWNNFDFLKMYQQLGHILMPVMEE
ncbi:MAG: ester cyclase [Chitinophagaceae bacterium]